MYISSSSPSQADGYTPNSGIFNPWIDSEAQVKFFGGEIFGYKVSVNFLKIQECSSTSPACGNNCTSLSTLHGSDYDCGNCLGFDHTLR